MVCLLQELVTAQQQEAGAESLSLTLQAAAVRGKLKEVPVPQPLASLLVAPLLDSGESEDLCCVAVYQGGADPGAGFSQACWQLVQHQKQAGWRPDAALA